MRCPRCSGELVEGEATCPGCGWLRPVRPARPVDDPTSSPAGTASVWFNQSRSQSPEAGPQPDEPLNNSGTGGAAPFEVRAMGFSWGGFSLPVLFSIANNIMLGCVLGLLAGIVGAIWLGLRGHEEAWKHRRFRSFDEFRRTMRVWNWWGLALLFVQAGFYVLTLLFSIGSYWTFGGGTSEPADEALAVSNDCFQNAQKLARALEIYGYDTDGRLPPATNWRPAVSGLMPGGRIPECLTGAIYTYNANAGGRQAGLLPERAVIIYEGDAAGRVLLPHRGSAHMVGPLGHVFTLCEGGEAVNWLGKPPATAAEGAGKVRQ